MAQKVPYFYIDQNNGSNSIVPFLSLSYKEYTTPTTGLSKLNDPGALPG
jgi:hypothetical protein